MPPASRVEGSVQSSMMNTIPSNGNGRERVNFSKIHTSVPIPNLIEVQKRSYERFLQIYTAPQDREDTGLQAVFKSIFPISDFRQTCSLEFVEYTIGNWECKCGKLEGLEHLRITCVKCGKKTISQNPKAPRHTCPDCGWANENRVDHSRDVVPGRRFIPPHRASIRVPAVPYRRDASIPIFNRVFDRKFSLPRVRHPFSTGTKFIAPHVCFS